NFVAKQRVSSLFQNNSCQHIKQIVTDKKCFSNYYKKPTFQSFLTRRTTAGAYLIPLRRSEATAPATAKEEDATDLLITSHTQKHRRSKKMPDAVPAQKRKELQPPPKFIEDRIELWKKFQKEYEERIASKTPEPIAITLPDGKEVPGESWRTTPFEVAKGISTGLAEATVISKLLKFDDPEAQAVFWHSSAHVLGEAMEKVYGGHLCYGPPIQDGFYYDMYAENDQVSSTDFGCLEGCIKGIVKEKQQFERLELTKEQLLEMFSHTGKIKALALTKNSATYWEGKNDAESLQRIYGISFPDPKQLKEWKHLQEEAAKRDHRKLGREQELFFFHELSPGSCFFLPKGAHIYNKLVNLIKDEYRKRGFNEVVTPNIYNVKLWQTSGHWQHYAENMFSIEIEKETFALKPMNCPGHCLMFDHRPRSWRELPLRMADFGVLHRNELSGALSGLTRVRRFQQDDAHIFCTPEQIGLEIDGALDFLDHIYGVFGFTFNLKLSTRPEKYLGDLEVWNEAERQLAQSLDKFVEKTPGRKWVEDPGDGAFYGPKIDITIMDALKRAHQCATIQLDFQLPIRFNLNYIGDDGEKRRPVIIHRAILGSVERMIAILTESSAGKWPFWLSPRQVMVVPVGPSLNEYAEQVQKKLFDEGFQAEVDTDPGDTMNKKIRNGQLAQFNFILVVGDKEKAAGTVNVRTRDNKVLERDR
ncbi:Threonine--tRNA ligase, cytoplasmic, partial [Orchesella cincta]